MENETIENQPVTPTVPVDEPLIVPKKITLPAEINIKDAVGFDRFEDVFEEFVPNQVVKIVPKKNQWTFYCNNSIVLRVEVLTERIVRFRYTYTRHFQKDVSYGLDPAFKKQEVQPVAAETVDFWQLKTVYLKIVVSKKDLRIKILDINDKIICEDADGYYARATMMHGTTDVRITKKCQPNERFFGLGDKSCSLELRGKSFENWCTDAFAFEPDTDPLYRAIPFFYGFHQNIGYGIFLDSPFKTKFNFDTEQNNTYSFASEGGEMNYYFIYGAALTEVARQYHHLTGKPELPPIWALGFHQCRWSYFPEKRVKDVAETFRKLKIPCDAIYLDIDYMDEYRCFTWNHKHFPDPTRMIADLQKIGFQTVVMIDPGIKQDEDFEIYAEGFENDYFLKRIDGELLIGRVWPSETVFPDFLNQQVREWWGDLYEKLYVENDIAGFWNDMNEPANFKLNIKTIPNNVLHNSDKEGIFSHAKGHNIYGMMMSQSSVEGFKKLRPKKRPFLVTRASYAGGQRHAAVWTGDNVATWGHLQMANRQIQRLSLSGFSFSGSDIGGFKDVPTGELLVRWLQLGIFHPFYRIHSMGNNEVGDALSDASLVSEAEARNRLDQEPWSFGDDTTLLTRQAIELRYKLLPYLYTTFYKLATEGQPMMLSQGFYDSTDSENFKYEQQFISGKHLLVAPVTEENLKKMSVYFPKGVWYDLQTGAQYIGNQAITITTPLSKIPIFAREGACIPMYPVMQFTGERPVEVLELRVFYTKKVELSELYEDSGEGYTHLKDNYALTRFKTDGTREHGFKITRQIEGTFKLTYHSIRLVINGLDFKPNICLNDNKPIIFTETEQNTYEIIVAADFKVIIFK
jgi:alpha-glucosidase